MISPKANQKTTERRAAKPARQLLYHHRLSEWISRETAENEAILESYLICSGEENWEEIVSQYPYVFRAGE